MATTKSDTSIVAAEKVVKRQEKQARREAKLMSEIDAAKKELKKAQNTILHSLEARLEELRAQSPQAATGTEPTSLLSEETRLPEGSVVMIDAAKMDALS